MADEFDLIVLGGGMAGLPVAFKSAYKGNDVVLIEDDKLGGTCLNRGCIPTKTMIRSAEVANLARRGTEFGVEIDGDVSVDMTSIRNRKDRVVNEIQTGTYENAANAENLELVGGNGTFASPTEIEVGDRTLTAETVIVNTGARPAKPPINGINDVEVLDSTSALELDRVPDSLGVVGGGYVGCEYAQMFARFGADVTVFQRPERLLPEEESEVSTVIEDAFTDDGIDVRTGTEVTELSEHSAVIEVNLDDGDTQAVSDLLVAAGRRPNTDELNLDDTDVTLDENGFIEVDTTFQTNDPQIYAIGDVTGPPMFTHSARDDADLLYRHVEKGEDIDASDRVVPHAVFTDPQVGHVGLTEAEARDQGYEVAVGRSEYAEQGKPKALGEPDGFVKLVVDAETGELLGAHIVGEQGAEIVHELVVAMKLGGTASDVADAIHIHPTLPEVINSAAGGVHKPS
jgi:dihydrolipoamide dehydrogenase